MALLAWLLCVPGSAQNWTMNSPVGSTRLAESLEAHALRFNSRERPPDAFQSTLQATE